MVEKLRQTDWLIDWLNNQSIETGWDKYRLSEKDCYIYIYIYWEKEREREGEKERKKER